MDQTTPPISPSHDALSDEGPPSSPASRRNLTVSSNLLAWGTASAVVGLFILRFGYHVGWSDQDEFLPLIQHWIDPNLFTHDWFVMMQTSTFGASGRRLRPRCGDFRTSRVWNWPYS